MCFSLVFACLSVRQSGAGSQEPCPATPHPHLPAPLWKERAEQAWSPQVQREQAGRAAPPWVQSPIYVCACVCACMYMGNLCASMYKWRGSLSQRLGQVGLLEARPAWMASSQVDPPQVSRRCDGVALWAELLGTQGPQPALLAVHMPTLDRREGHRV